MEGDGDDNDVFSAADLAAMINSDGTVNLERDNQFGPDARIKRIYEFSTSAWAADPTTTVAKTLVKDLVPYLEAPGGLLYEKIEGMALMDDGNVYVCNDNDGVDDNSGETQLLNVGGIL